MADGVNTVEVYLDNILQVLHDMINNDNRWVKQVKQLSYAIACWVSFSDIAETLRHDTLCIDCV